MTRPEDVPVAGIRESMLRHESQGPDVRLELEHLVRNLALDEGQVAKAKEILKSHKEVLKGHAAARKEHREKTMALHREIERLNKGFEGVLKRMRQDELAWRAQVRRILGAEQRARFDAMMVERDRLEQEWQRRVIERMRDEAAAAAKS